MLLKQRYVRSNYANDGRMDDDKRYIRPPPSTPPSFGKGCSTWENYVRSLCDTFHIPRELRDALIDCGSKYSLSALHESMPQHCLNASFSNSLSALFGKRNSPSMINIDTDETTKNDGKRHSNHDDHHDTESMGSARFSPYILHNDPFPPIFATWCQHFSRSVRISHPFKSSNFNNTGNHWILDVYRLTNLHKMPKFYAHCFVGCGLKYVLYGFHVPLWQSLVYIQQIN